MIEIKIDDNIPIPGPHRFKCVISPKKVNIATIANKLQIGQSFVCALNITSYARTELGRISKNKNKKFLTRTVVEDGNRVLRVWRVE